MSYQQQGVKDLSYKIIILKHMDRLSGLLTVPDPEVMTETFWKVRGEDKLDNFNWGVLFLLKMIPDPFKDKNYKEELEECNKADNDADSLPVEMKRSVMRFKQFQAVVNLLQRRGLLLENTIVGRKHKPLGIPETVIEFREQGGEEWEN